MKYYDAILKIYFSDRNMTTMEFGSPSNSFQNKFETSLIVHKRYLRTNYLESNFEEVNDMKSLFKIKKLLFLQVKVDAACKSLVDSGLNDPSVIRNTAHVNFND